MGAGDPIQKDDPVLGPGHISILDCSLLGSTPVFLRWMMHCLNLKNKLGEMGLFGDYSFWGPSLAFGSHPCFAYRAVTQGCELFVTQNEVYKSYQSEPKSPGEQIWGTLAHLYFYSFLPLVPSRVIFDSSKVWGNLILNIAFCVQFY